MWDAIGDSLNIFEFARSRTLSLVPPSYLYQIKYKDREQKPQKIGD